MWSAWRRKPFLKESQTIRRYWGVGFVPLTFATCVTMDAFVVPQDCSMEPVLMVFAHTDSDACSKKRYCATCPFSKGKV